MNYITSDQHFNHKNIIMYCNRPFDSVEEMNEELIKRWNSVVSEGDIIFHLGDLFLGKKEEFAPIIERLNGKIVLIKGNHDRLTTRSYTDLGIVVLNQPTQIGCEFSCGEVKYIKGVVLSHRPLPDRDIPEGYINVHGHIHDIKLEDRYLENEYSPDKHINVSCDVTDFKPITLDDIIEKM